MRALHPALIALAAAGAAALAYEAGRAYGRKEVLRAAALLTRRRPGFVRAALASGAEAMRLMEPPRPTPADGTMSRVDFARHARVTPGRVAQWIATGRINATSLAGEGQGASIYPAKAIADLKSSLHRRRDGTTPSSAATDR